MIIEKFEDIISWQKSKSKKYALSGFRVKIYFERTI